MNIKKELCPKGIDFHPSEFVVSDKWCTILTVVSYPKWIGPGFLSNITSNSGVKVVVKHLPLPFSVMSKMLNKQLAELKENYQKENDKTAQEQIRQDYDSLNEFIQMITANQAKIFDFQMHIIISANTKEELEQKKLQIKNYLSAMELRAIPLRFEQKKVLKSILPIYPKQDIEDQIGTPITSPTVAAMYPFIFDSLKDPGLSCLLGTDFSGGVVLFNQFYYQLQGQSDNSRNNANMIILGTSGSGKSTAAKLLLRSYVRNDYKVVVIDPEGELEDMAAKMQGDFIDMGRGGTHGIINPLEVIADTDEDEDSEGVLGNTIQTIKAFMAYYDPTITEDVLTLLGSMLALTYERFGMTVETNFFNIPRDRFPTFSDLYETVVRRLEAYGDQITRERDILESLELKLRPLVNRNEMGIYFNGHTTIDPKSKFVVFNTKELMNASANIRNALFFNILKFAWSQCLDRNINTVMMVDEAHILLSGNNTLGADFLSNVQRRARKYNTGTLFITQQPTDFASEKIITHGKAIFDNASYYLIMNLKKQAVEDLGLLIDLNEQEKESIKKYSQGEALFVVGERRMRVDVLVTEAELDSFGDKGGF